MTSVNESLAEDLQGSMCSINGVAIEILMLRIALIIPYVDRPLKIGERHPVQNSKLVTLSIVGNGRKGKGRKPRSGFGRLTATWGSWKLLKAHFWPRYSLRDCEALSEDRPQSAVRRRMINGCRATPCNPRVCHVVIPCRLNPLA